MKSFAEAKRKMSGQQVRRTVGDTTPCEENNQEMVNTIVHNAALHQPPLTVRVEADIVVVEESGQYYMLSKQKRVQDGVLTFKSGNKYEFEADGKTMYGTAKASNVTLHENGFDVNLHGGGVIHYRLI